MSHEIHDNTTTKSVDKVELEAATNATFDAWTKGARDFCQKATKFVEDLDDHTTLLMTDVFGPEVARKHSIKLEEEAKREAAAGHTDAANHYKRRDLNISRTTLGENDEYTCKLMADLKTPEETAMELRIWAMFESMHTGQKNAQLLKDKLNI